MASKNPLPPPSSVSDCDLWIIPPAAHSQWFARIDWYLNWQMSKGLAFQRQKPSVELFRVLEETGVKFNSHPVALISNLMVASSGKVGSERCVVVEYDSDLRPWLKTVHQLCADLQSKRARVFLPKGSGVSDVHDLWKKMAPLDVQLEFSTDEDKTI